MNIPGPITTVAICLITYKRPNSLSRLLNSLAQLEFTQSTDVVVQVIVVDNDETASAKATVEQATKEMRWPLLYAVESQRGISFARNHAVALATGHEFVAFVDDDEIVDQAWLDQLLAAQRLFRADIVAGPVVSVFEVEPPRWVLRGHFFDRPRYPSGKSLPFCATNNVLIRREILNRFPGPFDARFALTGGSDTLLMLQLTRSGARLVWCDDAVVYEYVPASRVRVEWIVRRAYRRGNTHGRCVREVEPSIGPLSKHLTIGVGNIVVGLAGLLPSIFFGPAAIVQMLKYIARGAGRVLGLMGYAYEEYRTVHGT